MFNDFYYCQQSVRPDDSLSDKNIGVGRVSPDRGARVGRTKPPAWQQLLPTGYFLRRNSSQESGKLEK